MALNIERKPSAKSGKSDDPHAPGATHPFAEGGGTMPQVHRERLCAHPGKLVVSAVPATVTVVLGSAVAVCLWDGDRGIGGVNHFMLPVAPPGAGGSPRFGNVAMSRLLDTLVRAGARRSALRAHVFGGACMRASIPPPAHVGTHNIDMAIGFLAEHEIEIAMLDIGGKRGRKIIFNTDEGTACLTVI